MVLSGGLSNHPFRDLLQCLTSSASVQARRRAPRARVRAGWPDGRFALTANTTAQSPFGHRHRKRGIVATPAYYTFYYTGHQNKRDGAP